MVREGQAANVDAVSELGIYGTFVRKGRQVLSNNEAGLLLRTKVVLHSPYFPF